MFSFLGLGQPSSPHTPMPTPRCLPFSASVLLPLPWFFPLLERMPSYVLNPGATSRKAPQRLVQVNALGNFLQFARAQEYRYRSCWLHASRLPRPTSAHVPPREVWLAGGSTSIQPVFEKLVTVKRLTAEKRRKWISGLGDTVNF